MLVQQGHDIEEAYHLLRREAAAAESNRISTPRGFSEAERELVIDDSTVSRSRCNPVRNPDDAAR